MADETSLEAVRISLFGENATILYADSTVVQLASEVLNRSTLLQQAVTDTQDRDEVCLSLPVGVVRAWVQALNEVGELISFRDTEPESDFARHPKNMNTLLECLQAADFLGDTDAVSELCKKASHKLFAPYIEEHRKELENDLAQELFTLHGNLQRSVLAASKVPLLMQLSLLPQTMHQVALHAAFPSIVATSSMTASSPLCTSELSDAFWQLLGAETGLKQLQCTNSVDEDMFVPHSLLACISKLPLLESLSIVSTRLGCSRSLQLFDCLQCHRVLTHLELSGNQSCQHEGSLPEGAPQVAEAIGKLTALRSLNISLVTVESSFIEAFGSALAQLRSLETLKLSCGVREQCSTELVKHISRCTALKTVICSGMTATMPIEFLTHVCSCDGLQHLELPLFMCRRELLSEDALKHLSKLQVITELRVALFRQSSGVMKTFSDHASSLMSLRRLHVHGDDDSISTSGAALGTLVAALSRLESISIHGAPFCASGSVLTASLAKVPSLKHISLAHVRLDSGGVQALASSLKRLTGLQSLKLHSIRILNEGAKVLAQALVLLTCLTELYLADDAQDDKAFKLLVEPIGRLTGLQSLSLAYSRMIARGCSILGHQLCRLTSLRVLALAASQFPDAATAASIAEHIGTLACLESFTMKDTSIALLGETSARAVLSALGHLTALQFLTLSGNGLTCSEVEYICAHLVNLELLKRLDLSRNRIGDRGAKVLARFVRTLPSLEFLTLSRNRIACVQELKSCPYVSAVLVGLGNQMDC